MKLDESMLRWLAAEVRILRKKLDHIGSKPYTHHDAQFAVAAEVFVAPQPCEWRPTATPSKEFVLEDLPHQRTECRLPVQLALDALVVRSGCGDCLHPELNPSAKDFVPTSAYQRVCIIDDADELFELDQQIRVSQPVISSVDRDMTRAIPILSRLEELVDELLSEISLAHVLALPTSHENVNLEHSPMALGGEVVVAGSVPILPLDERFVASKLLRDLGEILSCGRPYHELTDHFLKAGLIMYRTLIAMDPSQDQQCRADGFLCGTAACSRCTWLAAIVGTLMSEYPYILRGDLFLQLDGKEIFSDGYLSHLVQLLQQNIEKRQQGQKFSDYE
jgi:hypothetical protein